MDRGETVIVFIGPLCKRHHLLGSPSSMRDVLLLIEVKPLSGLVW